MPQRNAHWLRRNEASRYPRRIVCLDSESVTTLDGRHETHKLRCAVASFDRIDRETRQPAKSDLGVFLDAGELWAWVDSLTNAKERTVVFAHNLGFDLRLTSGLVELPKLDWNLQAFSLDAYRCWSRWRRDNRTLLMVDTMSFVGRGLAAFEKALGVSKTELPAHDAPLALWVERCKADVHLLRRLVLRLLGWLEGTDCGNFKMTGPAQASAHFRHNYLGERRILVHNDDEAIVAERQSSYTGRCEIWRHGELKAPMTEWDFSLAYARIARDAMLPSRYRGRMAAVSAERIRQLARGLRVLATVRVKTDAPVVPTEHDGRIIWPVGEFVSTLWDCELALLDEAGVEWEPTDAWLYHAQPILREWAHWVIDSLEGPDAEQCEIARAVIKQWSRALIGRFGLRYPRWEQFATTPNSNLVMFTNTDGTSGEYSTMLHLGNQVIAQTGVEESPDSAPAIMAYVMALARVRLWRAMSYAGFHNLVYVDTDSIVVLDDANPRMAAFANTLAGEGLRVKRRARAAMLWAPRQVELGGELKIAGVPRKAKRAGARTFRAHTWEGPAESLRRGRPSTVTVSARTIRLRAVDHRRRHLSGGFTGPVRVEPSGVGRNAASAGTAAALLGSAGRGRVSCRTVSPPAENGSHGRVEGPLTGSTK